VLGPVTLTGLPELVGIFGGAARHLPWSARDEGRDLQKAVGTRIHDVTSVMP
jgi:hypothetical protein